MRKKIKYLLLTLITVILCTTVLFFDLNAAAATMPSSGTANLKVVDISQWNDSITSSTDDINFPMLKTQVDAVYIRAFGNSNGVSYIDKQAVNYAKSAQNANLRYGFYYYYIPTVDLTNAKAQAQSYYTFVKNYAYSCVPALDVEENPNNLSKAELALSVQTFANEFKSLSGFDMMIYSYPYFMKNNFDPSMNWTAYKFWVAHYNVSAPMEGISSAWMPQSLWSWERWDMWQYTSSGSLSSIPNSSGGSLDINNATDNILLSTPIALTTLDSPSATADNGGDITINGWTLSHSGISRVDIYTDDNKLVGSTSYLYERPDVQSMMNSNGRYNDGLRSGFSYIADASLFTTGRHNIYIAAISRNGSVSWSSYSFTVGPASQICLDAPSGDAMIGGDLTVSGWAVSHAGISRVDIYMDDYQWIGSTPNMYERSDVNNIVNSSGLFKNALNSGFSYTIDASLMRPGIHVVKVAAISRDGTAQWTTKTITVGPVSQIYLDTPSSETVIGGDVTVSGWAVSHAGISRIDIYMDDNQWIGSTPNMYERADVNSIVNSSGLFKNALNSGFSYTIDASLMTPGTHVVKVAAISRDGTAQWTEKTITVGPAPRICLDTPPGDAMIGGDLTVSGWAVSHAGISRVDIYMDDYQWIGSTPNMYERADVNNIVNSSGLYKNGLNSGFSYTIDAILMTPGTHVVKVAAISRDGTAQWTQKTITVGPASRICLDAPSGDAMIDGDLTVSGWAVSRAGISRVDIYMDDYQWIGSTPNMYEREDVNNIVNSSGLYKTGLNSGFSYTIDAGLMTPGTHVVKVAAISRDGTAQWTQKTFVVQ